MKTTLDRPSDSGPEPHDDEGTVFEVPLHARRRLPWVQLGLLALVLIVGLVWGAKWLLHDRARITTDDAYIDTDQVMVMSRISERVARVLVEQNAPVKAGQPLVLLDDAQERARLAIARSNLSSLESSATAARRAAALEAELQAAQVRGGAGRVDAAQRAVAVARDQEAAAQTAVGVAQQNLEAARAAVRVADAALPAAQAAVRKAEVDQRRTEQLARAGYVSASALESAQTITSQARSAYEVAREQSASARVAVAGAQARLAQERANAAAAHSAASAAQSQVAVAGGGLAESAAANRVPSKEAQAASAGAGAGGMAAQLRLAELDLASTRIVAPVDGWVAQRSVEVGQTVAPGQALITISPAKRIFVTANYKETQLGRIRPGQDVEIAVDACRGHTFMGKVVGLAPVAQSALSSLPTLTAPSNFVKVAQRVPVRISLPKDGAGCVFRPGMSVETSVLGG